MKKYKISSFRVSGYALILVIKQVTGVKLAEKITIDDLQMNE